MPPSVGGLRLTFGGKLQFSLFIQLLLEMHPLKNRICDTLFFTAERSKQGKNLRPFLELSAFHHKTSFLSIRSENFSLWLYLFLLCQL